MMRTKPFLIMVIALIVFLIWILIIDTGIETTASPQSVGMVIMAEPRDLYGIEYEATDNRAMQRAIFIEKVRSTLHSNPITQPVAVVEERLEESPETSVGVYTASIPVGTTSSSAAPLPVY